MIVWNWTARTGVSLVYWESLVNKRLVESLVWKNFPVFFFIIFKYLTPGIYLEKNINMEIRYVSVSKTFFFSKHLYIYIFSLWDVFRHLARKNKELEFAKSFYSRRIH